MNILAILISLKCLLPFVETASSYEINRGWVFQKVRPAKTKRLERFLNLLEAKGSLTPTHLAISWIEGRLRIGVKRGDRGKACGLFQIHARYSYPMFSRKRGFNGWVESENKMKIAEECRKLERTDYSISVLNKYLEIMERRELHPCHHNSGLKGRCNQWYKQRLDFWITYFQLALYSCGERTNLMAMMKTGNPIPTAPAPMLQGYLDGMSGAEPNSEDTVYKSGYDLAKLVKEGKAQPPVWATPNGSSEG
jgi:hypothetical protein